MNHFSVEGCSDDVDEPAVRVEEEVDRLGEVVSDEFFKGKKKTFGKAASKTSFDRVRDLKTSDSTARAEMFPSLKRDTLG
jgi:hypothetical protein